MRLSNQIVLLNFDRTALLQRQNPRKFTLYYFIYFARHALALP